MADGHELCNLLKVNTILFNSLFYRSPLIDNKKATRRRLKAVETTAENSNLRVNDLEYIKLCVLHVKGRIN